MNTKKVKQVSKKENNEGDSDLVLDLDLGHKIIKLAEKLGAHDTEVFMVKGTDTSFSIENDMVTFSQSSTEFGIGIRLIRDKRLGFGYCTTLESAESALKNALAAAKLAKQLEFEFINEMSKIKTTGALGSIYDKQLLELDVADGLKFTDQLIESSKESNSDVIVTGGGVGYGGGSVGIINSNGFELQYSGTGIYAGVSTILKDKTISTGFEYEHSRSKDIDMTKIGKIASELAIKGQNTKKIDPGDYFVIFTPHSLGELLEFTVIPSLYGEAALKGETAYSNKLGEDVASQGISLIDSGILENGINSAPFDDEGTPCQENILIENGILKKYLFDRLSALEFNESSTGNAVRTEGFSGGRNYKALPKTKALNFTIHGNTKDLNDIIKDQGNALIVHQLLGSHTANPASGDFSVNCPTLFKIEKGDIVYAGKQVMISGNMPELLKKIVAVANDYKNVSGGLTPIAQRLPSILFQDVKII